MKIIIDDHEIDIGDQDIVDVPSLKEHGAFHKTTDTDLFLFGQNGMTFAGQRGQVICRQGDDAEFLYFLLSGKVSLSAEEKLVTFLEGRSGHFGWNRFEDRYAFSATVESETATLFKMHKDALLSLFQNKKSLGEQLYLYCIPFGAYLFFRIFNLESFVVDQEDFHTSFQGRFYRPGAVVFNKGEKGDKFYIIASGSAKVTTNHPGEPEKIVNHLHGGEYFGEIALLEDQVRAATVSATENLAVFTLSRDAFNSFLSGRKGKFVRKYLRENINKYTVEIDDITIGSAPDCAIRIASEKIAPYHVGLTRKTTHDGRKQYVVRPLDLSSPLCSVYVNRQEIIGETALKEKDDVYVGSFRIIIDAHEGTIRVLEIDYYSLLAEKLHYEIDKNLIIDLVSFPAESHELVCIMGPSGCGKTTLLEMISGAKKQTSGNILYNQDPLYENLKFYQDSFGFVAQDDILFSELTVFENLYFSAKLRDPFIDRKKLDERISEVLKRLKLFDKKDKRVGSVEKKGLSGGERKRVNIARELVFGPHVLFVDEPTSGLSSKDSEEIVSLLREIADTGKLVFVVLHQPSSKIYKMFDKIVLLDQGGKLVYTGSVIECIDYMKEAVNEKSPAECPQCGICQPEHIFEILELKTDGGERRFSPDFWQKRFQEKFGEQPHLSDKADDTRKKTGRERKKTLGEDVRQMGILLRRTFLVKVKDWHNVFVSLGAPIAIAMLIGYILDYCPTGGSYSFYQNKLILTYLFIGVIFSVFIGLTNSVRDIVSEQAVFNNESKVRLRVRWYVLSKFLVLSFIAAIQVAIFLLVCNVMLHIEDMFILFFIFLYMGAIFGVSLGLFLSSFARTSDSVVNWIPLVLIPQIILGGALIEYEDIKMSSYVSGDAAIPVFCQVIPSRWAHEAVVVAQATLNLRDVAIKKSNMEIKEVKQRIRQPADGDTVDKGELAALRERKKQLLKEKAGIDDKYPIKSSQNELMEEAVMDANGQYTGYKESMVDGDSGKDHPFLTTYNLVENHENIGKGWLFGPFYAEYKGIAVGGTFYEIMTVYFNTMVLLAMTVLDLALCMVIMRRKRRKHLYV